MYASTGDNAGTVQALLKAGAKVNLVDQAERFSPLMFAAAEGQTEVVALLLKAGADKSLTDIDGDTALSFAKQNGHQATVQLLGD